MSEEPKRRALGRGLSALFGDEVERPRTDLPGEGPTSATKAPRDMLHTSKLQPRRHFDPEAMEALTQSVREQGILQPILVRPSRELANGYEIVAGERRWRAAAAAGLKDVPILVRDLSDRDTLEIALIENVQRQDLGPFEEAEGYQRLIDEFGHTQDALAKALGKSRSHIANMLRLLQLPEPVRDLVQAGKLTSGHARALIGAPEVARLALRVVESGMSVRETEQLAQRAKASDGKAGSDVVRRTKPNREPSPPDIPAKDDDTIALEQDLAALLGLPVTIDHQGRSGAVTIHYASLEQLDDLIQRFNTRG